LSLARTGSAVLLLGVHLARLATVVQNTAGAATQLIIVMQVVNLILENASLPPSMAAPRSLKTGLAEVLKVTRAVTETVVPNMVGVVHQKPTAAMVAWVSLVLAGEQQIDV
jgi:hypothetical protein